MEQNPSDELIIRVSPSFDLVILSTPEYQVESKGGAYHVRSVNVAKCRLLTTHIGVCCWVSYTMTPS